MPAILNFLPSNFEPRSTVYANDSSTALQVLCAWPVSGQYGPGSRVLYYVLVATCVLARKSEWLRNACLAAALLVPAVAAIHGIVLAAVHVGGAVDMDVYGAFQICSLGILAAPITVRLSSTYFNNPGRNTIFLWTGLILAGLLSLTVEFFRISTVPCLDASGKPISVGLNQFMDDLENGSNITCGLVCDVDQGPFSPIRQGSANNIYVIPAPTKLTIDTATLLAAACCIPAILSLVVTWNKILEINWKSRFGLKEEEINEPIAGANGATIGTMKNSYALVRKFLSAVEVPVFGAAVLAILVAGELNFFSRQVDYQTEPIGSVGQWAPIAGTAIAIVGSLLLLLSSKPDDEKNETSTEGSIHHCTCTKHPSSSSGVIELRGSCSDDGRGHPVDRTTTVQTVRSSATADAGNRRRVAKALNSMGDWLGTAGQDYDGNQAYKRGRSRDFPEIPGEAHRNAELRRIKRSFDPERDIDGNVTPNPRSRSRAGSFKSEMGVEGGSTTPTATSPTASQPAVSVVTFSPSSSHPERPVLNHVSHDRTVSSPTVMHSRQRSDTLQVPQDVHVHPVRSNVDTITIDFGPARPG